MKVTFIPIWPKNPYHRHLISNLVNHGVTVITGKTIKEITDDVRANRELPNIVHFHALPEFSWDPMAFIRLYLMVRRIEILKKAGIRVMLTVHDLLPHETKFRAADIFFGRILGEKVDAIFVHSLSARNEIIDAWGLSKPSKIHVIRHPNFIECYPNTIEREAARKNLDLFEDSIVFLFLGLIRPYKGLTDLIEAFRGIGNDRARLLIVGEPLNDKVAKDIKIQTQSDARIKLISQYVGEEDIQIYMNAADMVVLPYRRAFTSGAALLAMSFAKACIATKTGAFPEVLGCDGTFFCAPNDPVSLRKALQLAIDAIASLPYMGRSNRQRAEQWRWDVMGRDLAELYAKYLIDPSLTPPNTLGRN